MGAPPLAKRNKQRKFDASGSSATQNSADEVEPGLALGTILAFLVSVCESATGTGARNEEKLGKLEMVCGAVGREDDHSWQRRMMSGAANRSILLLPRGEFRVYLVPLRSSYRHGESVRLRPLYTSVASRSASCW